MKSLRASRAVKSAIGLMLCALFLLAQQPPAATPAPPIPDAVFKVTTTLVQVDAVVTDSKGHYVTDLTADDFAMFEDGKPQKITNFSYVNVGSPAPAAPQTPKKSPKAEPPLPPALAAPLHPEDVRRTIVLMVDDLGLSFESMAYVRKALRKFVEQQMQPGDLVSVCRTAAGSGVLQQFTTDKRILLSVINGLHYNLNGRQGINFFEPYGKYSSLAQGLSRGDPARPSGAPGSLDPAYELGRNSKLAVGTLGAIRYIVGALHEMPGRKSIVLFSDGLPLFTLGQGPIMHLGMDSTQYMGSNGEVMMAMHKLIDRANRSGTVIYTIHAAGLQPGGLDAADNIDMTGMTGQQANATLNALTDVGALTGRDVAFNAGQQGLAYLALETGGIPYENGNDMNYGLAHVLADQQGYYLIGFIPPSDTFEGKHASRDYHHVTVKVTRPGLHVRSRSGFFGETDDQIVNRPATPVEQMRAAMLSPFYSAGVRLRLTALYAEVPKRGPVVRNLLHIDTRDLTFRTSYSLDALHDAPPESMANIEILAVATSMGDLPVATVARSFTMHAPDKGRAEAIEQGALYTLDVPVKKRGAYQIQAAVRDVATGKVGSASQFLEIPELKKGRVALTSILLQDTDRPAGEPAWTGMSPAVRQFHPGGEIEYFCLIESAGKVTAADLDSQIRIVRDGKDVYTGPAKFLAISGGGMAFTGKLKLSAKMTPGDYYLGIVAAQPNARKNAAAVQWTDFEITP
ncbi:MAG: VWA domain-containing protein [Bryobacteraceae bacterium]